MKTYNKQIITAAIIASMSAMSACSSDDDDEEATTTDVSIKFAAQINGQNFTCGDTFTGIGNGGDNLQVTDFRMYVHNVRIHDALTDEDHALELTQDGVWQVDDLALLDFADGSAGCSDASTQMNTEVNGTVTVPATIDLSAAEICFDVGMPAEKNHIDASASTISPLNAAGMFWFWKDGYKYIRIDGTAPDSVSMNKAFNLHLGAQGCPGDGTLDEKNHAPVSACTEPNIVEVCIANFDVENSVVSADPAPVMEANDVKLNLSGNMTPPGCQSFVNDADCDEVMPRLGLDYSGYGMTGNTSTYTGAQQMFTKQ